MGEYFGHESLQRRLQLKASSKVPFTSRSWFEFPWALKNVPIEPVLKVLLPFVGINGELWAGHVSYRLAVSMPHFTLAG